MRASIGIGCISFAIGLSGIDFWPGLAVSALVCAGVYLIASDMGGKRG